MKTRLVVSSFVLPFALAACAGGGGGGTVIPATPAPTPTPTPTPVPLTTSAISISAPYKIDNATNTGSLTQSAVTDTSALLSTLGSVGLNGSISNVSSATINSTNASVNGSGSLTIGTGTNETVFNDIDYFLAYNDAANNGLNATKQISGATATQIIAPGTYPTGSITTSYNYLTFGQWNECGSSPNCNTGLETGVQGWYVNGQETPVGSIPTSGTATYTGTLDGKYFSSTGAASLTTADLTVGADFANRSLTFNTTNSATYNDLTYTPNNNGTYTVSSATYAANQNLNMSGTLVYPANSNTFTGTITDTGGRNGTATGRFYGPVANEVGGVYGVAGTDGSTHTGSFVAK